MVPPALHSLISPLDYIYQPSFTSTLPSCLLCPHSLCPCWPVFSFSVPASSLALFAFSDCLHVANLCFKSRPRKLNLTSPLSSLCLTFESKPLPKNVICGAAKMYQLLGSHSSLHIDLYFLFPGLFAGKMYLKLSQHGHIPNE